MEVGAGSGGAGLGGAKDRDPGEALGLKGGGEGGMRMVGWGRWWRCRCRCGAAGKPEGGGSCGGAGKGVKAPGSLAELAPRTAASAAGDGAGGSLPTRVGAGVRVGNERPSWEMEPRVGIWQLP